jgi:hypothetical protein
VKRERFLLASISKLVFLRYAKFQSSLAFLYRTFCPNYNI